MLAASWDLAWGAQGSAAPGPSDHDLLKVTFAADCHPTEGTYRLHRTPHCRPRPEAQDERE
eukprot:10937911-Alexandrium_andersonii.AAC.1